MATDNTDEKKTESCCAGMQAMMENMMCEKMKSCCPQPEKMREMMSKCCAAPTPTSFTSSGEGTIFE